MRRRTTLIALAITTIPLALAGCNTSAGSLSTSDQSGAALYQGETTGSGFTFTVIWPEAGSRLIPDATNFVVIGVLDRTAWDQGDWVELGFTMLTQEDPTGIVGGIEPGTQCLIVAGAFSDLGSMPEPPPDDVGPAPGADPSVLLRGPMAGALAFGSRTGTTPDEGQTTAIELTLASTIDSVIVKPATTTMGVNDGIRMIATAEDDLGRMILVAPHVWEWAADPVGVVRIVRTSADGMAAAATTDPPPDPFPPVFGWALVLGTTQGGPVTVTATDSESGIAGTAEISVSGQGGVTLQGKVLTADTGSPVNDAHILVEDLPLVMGSASARQVVLYGDAFSEIDGTYSIPNLPPGHHFIEVFAPDGSGLDDMIFPIDIPFGVEDPKVLNLFIQLVPTDIELLIDGVEIDPWDMFLLPGEQGFFDVFVHDINGDPLYLEPTWLVYGPIGRINEAGEFRAGPMPGEGAVVAIVGTHDAEAHVMIGHGGPPPGPPSVIEGKVVDASAPHIPIGGADVILTYPPPPTGAAGASTRVDEPPPVATAVTGADGSYVLPEVPPGYYALCVEPAGNLGYAPGCIEVDVPPEALIRRFVTLVPSDQVDLIDTITIMPTGATLTPGSSLQFSAEVRDTSGNIMPLEPTWSSGGPIGMIDEQGLFSAGPDEGHGFILASIGPAWDETWIDVMP